VTDLAVIDIGEEGMVLREVAPGVTPDQVQAFTGPELSVAPDVREVTWE